MIVGLQYDRIRDEFGGEIPPEYQPTITQLQRQHEVMQSRLLKEMEAYTFTDDSVRSALSNTVWLQADVTANDELDQELLQRFGVFGPPTIIFFGTDGQQRHGYEVVGFMKAQDFTEHVNKAFAM